MHLKLNSTKLNCQIQSADNDNLATIVEELEYLEYSITGDTDLYERKSLHANGNRRRPNVDNKRQINGDEFPVYVDDFNYNLSQDVIINFVKLTGSSQIIDYYYYDVSIWSR